MESATCIMWKKASTLSYGIGATSNNLIVMSSTEDDGSGARTFLMKLNNTITYMYKPLHMMTNKITNVVDPTSNQDAATKKYVDDQNAAQTTYHKVVALYPNTRLEDSWGWVNTDEYPRVGAITVTDQYAYIYLSMPKDADAVTITGQLWLINSSGTMTLTATAYLERKVTTGSWTYLGDDFSIISHVGVDETQIDFAWTPSFTLDWVDGAQYRIQLKRELTSTIGVTTCLLSIYGVSIE
ncbi:hypothetical protein LCGC14_1831420 [marine sediment metagenome]|uniref:Uncharacterized protein n=1 Tax=marine sediment metagenome TaxID=412755 RepID=A0A0F9IVE9_9ZZZZ